MKSLYVSLFIHTFSRCDDSETLTISTGVALKESESSVFSFCLIRSFSSSRCPDMQKIACRYTEMARDKARDRERLSCEKYFLDQKERKIGHMIQKLLCLLSSTIINYCYTLQPSINWGKLTLVKPFLLLTLNLSIPVNPWLVMRRQWMVIGQFVNDPVDVTISQSIASWRSSYTTLHRVQS